VEYDGRREVDAVYYATMNYLYICTLTFILPIFFSSCASNLSSQSDVSTVPASVSSSERGIAERVYSLVNRERVREGRSSLRGHGGLNVLAQKHSEYLSSNTMNANHLGSENRAQYAYLKYNIENLSEMTYAVPSGSGDPAAVAVSAWANSSSHRKHMLQSWDLTGVGVKKAPSGVTYVTMCVGARPMGVPRGIQPIGWQ